MARDRTGTPATVAGAARWGSGDGLFVLDLTSGAVTQLTPVAGYGTIDWTA